MALKHNMTSFMRETEREIKKELAKQESKAKTIVLTAHDMIINASPVDTGYFRANNFLTVDKTTDLTLADGKDNYFAEVDKAVSEANRKIKNLKFHKISSITIQNNVVYGDKLESGHHSKQAPRGVYGVTEQRIKPLLNQKIK